MLVPRKAFGIALRRFAATVKERAGLAQERTLLRRKSKVLKSAGWTFEADAAPDVNAPALASASIEAKLEEIEEQLRALGGDGNVLNDHLDRLIEMLGEAEKQLWKERRLVIVDRMCIKRERPSDTALELDLEELHNALGRTAIMLPDSISRDEVSTGGDLLAEAKRYLG